MLEAHRLELAALEGIRDGRGVDDCYHCALVDPGARPCPRCGNRMRYLGAEMTTTDDVAGAIAHWREHGEAIELLELLWRRGGDPEQALREAGGPALAAIVASAPPSEPSE